MGGRDINFSYAAEISADISNISNGGDGIFSRIVNLVLSFLSWSVATFGNTAGKILGWLGVGTPLLFILWIIKKIIGFFINRYIISPAKK